MNETEQQAIQTEPTQPSVPVETPAEVASGSGSRSEFLQQLPEEIRDHPSLQSINDVGNLGLSYVNAQRLIGADKIPLPKNPTEDDLNNIYSKLGRPDEPSGYAIQADGQILTEGDVNTYTDIAHKLGLSKAQANGILDYYRSSIQQTTEAMSKDSEQQRQQIEQSLKAEWGADYDAKVTQANRAVSDIAGEDLLQMVLEDGTKVGNHPAFIKAFANFADFKIPTMHESPKIQIKHLETITEYSETGAKGLGEGGLIGAPGAILSAINNALEQYGEEIDFFPVHPNDIREVLRRHEQRK